MVAGLVAPFFLPSPDGGTMFDASDMKHSLSQKGSAIKQWFLTIGSDSKEAFSRSGDGQSQTYYKWQDEQGTWHFSENKEQSPTTETIVLHPDTNVIASTPIEKTKSSEKKDSGKPLNIPLPTTIPASDIQQLIQDAGDVQGLVDDRAKNIEKMYND